ncbi:unnamed protein product [Moneuplotes crassus]|uniref:Uncharacterized protein n=1 Tax=Euplotes crassus TaxID=5936 RepID=A0AAD1U0L0_EUPCR|nr:unnamed protein product [Moneuplotes crassus]
MPASFFFNSLNFFSILILTVDIIMQQLSDFAQNDMLETQPLLLGFYKSRLKYCSSKFVIFSHSSISEWGKSCL